MRAAVAQSIKRQQLTLLYEALTVHRPAVESSRTEQGNTVANCTLQPSPLSLVAHMSADNAVLPNDLAD